MTDIREPTHGVLGSWENGAKEAREQGAWGLKSKGGESTESEKQ